MTTAVQDRAFDGDSKTPLEALKAYLRIPESDTSDDYILQKAIDGALVKADKYCNNPFEDEDGNDEPIPADVEIGCLVYASIDAFRQEPNIIQKSGKYTEQFRKPKEAKEQVQSDYWGEHRLIPGT